MWALLVLRASYLAVELHARAATLASLSPRDLYSVNLGSVVGCETSIRPLYPAHQWFFGPPGQQHRRWSERDGWRSPVPQLKVFVECVICIGRAGRCGARGAFGSGGSSHRLLGLFFLRPLLATYRASQFFLSTAAHATHSLSPRQHEKSPLINYCFLPNKQQSEPRSPVIYTLK